MAMVTYSGAITDSGQREALPPVDGREVLTYTLSWTAYPGLLLRLVLRVILLLAVYAAAMWILRIDNTNGLANAGVFAMLVLALAWTAYDFAYLRTMKLYVDVQGVWLAQGLLPWHKGVNGVRWDEMGAACYEPSFLSWACKSYRINIRHRFTTDSELNLAHVKNGHIAVQSINRLLMLRAKALLKAIVSENGK
jgi:hypothetical protein